MIADIVHRATYRHPPELVWRAITTPEGLHAWLMVNDFREPVVGHRFQFRDRPRPFWDGICDCEVAEADMPRRFALRWGLNVKGEATRLSFELTPTTDGGTTLELRHGGLDGLMGWLMKKGMDKGWRRMVERTIPFVCDGLAKGAVPSREAVQAEFRKK
jgi:uncharacterized protein YndB with AHSA1/START domain